MAFAFVSCLFAREREFLISTATHNSKALDGTALTFQLFLDLSPMDISVITYACRKNGALSNIERFGYFAGNT